MSALHAWYQHCLEFFKGRPSVDMTAIASKLDEQFGPWSPSMGTRAEAVQHVGAVGGRMAAFKHKDAPKGSPEHKAFTFVSEMNRVARGASKRNPVLTTSDTLSGRIDSTHLKHYTEMFASHHDIIEHAPSGLEHGTVEGARAMPGYDGPVHKRSRVVEMRNRKIMAAGHSRTHTMADIQTLHAGVQHAIAAGAVSESDANRYHVMHAALHLNEARHASSYPGLAFNPSWGAMDSTALKVMQVGAAHLHHAGLGESQQKMTPLIAAAIESHGTHPWIQRSKTTDARSAVSFDYPRLHQMGSKEHALQMAGHEQHMARVDRARKKDGEGIYVAPPAPAAAPAAPKDTTGEPKTLAEYQSRYEQGEKFGADVHLKMAKLKASTKNLAPLDKALLFDAWRLWRGVRL